MATKKELMEIHNNYKQKVNDYIHIDDTYETYLREYDKVRHLDCEVVENLKAKICEMLAKRLKLLESYRNDELALQVARDIQFFF